MADSVYRFSSALGGFHKGDVMAYIEKTVLQHRSEKLEAEQTIAALREENRSLQQQLNLLIMATPVAAAQPVEPAEEAVCEDISVQEPVPEPEVLSAPELVSMELQAYRRAEAMERNTNNRVRKLCEQMELVCEDALNEFNITDAAVKQTIETMLEQASTLDQAYQGLSAALSASREKLVAMNNMLSNIETE